MENKLNDVTHYIYREAKQSNVFSVRYTTIHSSNKTRNDDKKSFDFDIREFQFTVQTKNRNGRNYKLRQVCIFFWLASPSKAGGK